ncbi:MAG: hypothetical protein LBH29_00220 [Elusimicrobiota bacterium]|nr:hypothetical protein [Elusimicrobiota bacterium]
MQLKNDTALGVIAAKVAITVYAKAQPPGVIAELQNQDTRQLELLLYIVLQYKEVAIHFCNKSFAVFTSWQSAAVFTSWQSAAVFTSWQSASSFRRLPVILVSQPTKKSLNACQHLRTFLFAIKNCLLRHK